MFTHAYTLSHFPTPHAVLRTALRPTQASGKKEILVFLTFSRASILGLAFSFFIFFVWVVVKKNSIKKMVLIIFAGLVALTGAFLLTKDKFELNEYNLRSINSRCYLWAAAVEMVVDHPVLGTGLETYPLYFPQYIGNEFYYYEEGLNFVSDRPHNEVLEIGVNGGVLAVFAYLYLVFWCFYKYFKDENSPVLNGLFLAFFVYFFQNLFTFSRTSHFVLFTLIISGICIYSVKRKKPVTINFSRFISVVFGILIVISSIFSFYSFVYKPYLAEANFTEYTQTSFPEKLNKAIYYAPYNSYFRYRALLNIETFDWSHIESIKDIEGETITALDWEAVIVSGDNFNESNEIFKKIIELNPDYPIARMDYGKFLFLNGFYHEAINEFEYFLEAIPEFWKWRFEIDEKTDYEKKQYHAFFLHSPDLTKVFYQLSEAYRKTQQHEKADFYAPYGEGAFLE